MTGGKETNDAVGKKVIWLPGISTIPMLSIFAIIKNIN